MVNTEKTYAALSIPISDVAGGVDEVEAVVRVASTAEWMGAAKDDPYFFLRRKITDRPSVLTQDLPAVTVPRRKIG